MLERKTRSGDCLVKHPKILGIFNGLAIFKTILDNWVLCFFGGLCRLVKIGQTCAPKSPGSHRIYSDEISFSPTFGQDRDKSPGDIAGTDEEPLVCSVIS